MSEMENMEPKIIKTQDENGEIHNFELVDIINIDDKEYGLLVYIDENPSEDEEEEVIIMKLNKEGDAYTFETIEDEDEFNKVVEYIETEAGYEFDDEDEKE